MEETKIALDAVQEALDIAREYGLETEVVTFALKFMQETPTLTVEEAITMGLNEWVK